MNGFISCYPLISLRNKRSLQPIQIGVVIITDLKIVNTGKSISLDQSPTKDFIFSILHYRDCLKPPLKQFARIPL